MYWRHILCNLVDGYIQKNSKIKKLLQESKELNIICKNCIKKKQKVKKAIVDTQLKNKNIIFGNDSNGVKDV